VNNNDFDSPVYRALASAWALTLQDINEPYNPDWRNENSVNFHKGFDYGMEITFNTVCRALGCTWLMIYKHYRPDFRDDPKDYRFPVLRIAE
jgi:hypothetical protein